MSKFYNRIIIEDDSNFIFLPSGTYPEEYIGLIDPIIYPNYYLENIKPWKDKGDYSNSRFDNWNIIEEESYPIQEYWEFIPDSIRLFGNVYEKIPNNIAVSSYGRIYDYASKTAIPTYMRKDGYLGVFNMMALHRIILYTFSPISNFLDMTVDHKNLNVTDNHLWNLQWMNIYDNIMRSINLENRTNPYFKKGLENSRGTMSDLQVELCCRALLTHKYSYSQIAYAIGITERQVKHIRDCDCHIDICKKYGIDKDNFDYRHLKGNTEKILPLIEEIQ